MSNSIKQFANLIISFVDRTLLPLLDTKMMQASKAIDQWSQVKNFLYQSDTIQIWKVQKFLLDMPLRPVNSQLRKVTADLPSKQLPNIRTASFYENDGWKAPSNQLSQHYEAEKKQNYTSTLLLNNDINKLDGKIENKINLQSFENLLSSFRKLCTNFENNHKKLVMDREAFTH